MIHFQVTVLNTAELLDTNAYGAGALMRWETSGTELGVYVEGGTQPLVSGTAIYDVWDSAGTPGVTWYRTRISDALGTTFSAYSAPVQDGVPTTYASLDRVLSLFETIPTNTARLARLTSLLGVATSQVIDEFDGRDYFRHPSSGSASWTAEGKGGDVLHLHYGLVALDLLELSYDGGTHYVSVNASDYMLLGDNPYSQEPVPTGEPYFHIRFTGYGGQRYFPATPRAARMTGAHGWPAIPEPLVEGAAQRARALAFASGDYSGSAPGGPDQYGRPAPADRFWPQSLYNFIQNERTRFAACHLGSGARVASWAAR